MEFFKHYEMLQNTIRVKDGCSKDFLPSDNVVSTCSTSRLDVNILGSIPRVVTLFKCSSVSRVSTEFVILHAVDFSVVLEVTNLR